MKSAVARTMVVVAVTMLMTSLLYACSSASSSALALGTASVSSSSSAANPFLGTWKGTGKDAVYVYSFKNNTEWELFMEKSGIRIPFYGGTYTYTSSEAALTATKELDSKTMGWKKTVLPPFPFIAELTDGGLQAPSAFGSALLKKQ